MSCGTNATQEAYERWAPLYPPRPHNPLMRAEQRAMLEMLPSVQGSLVLDLACGSGRYSELMRAAGAEQVIALDFCEAMLNQVANKDRVRASMMQLPFQSAQFDVIVSGLAVGHATDMRQWTIEAARVLRQRGILVYSDFHPDAIRAGMTRSFKDAQNVVWKVPHQTYEVSSQRAALIAAGMAVEQVAEIRMGIELNEIFPGSEEAYRRWHGAPVVLVVRASKG